MAGHGAGAGQVAARAPRRGLSPDRGRAAGGHRPGARSARLLARARRDPPRHQARQRAGERDGRGQDLGLRHRAPRALARAAGRRGGGHALLHGARAVRGPRGRRAHRHLRRRRDGLRGAVRQEPVLGNRRRPGRADPAHAAAAAELDRPAAAGRARRRTRQGARQGSGRALRQRARISRGAARRVQAERRRRQPRRAAPGDQGWASRRAAGAAAQVAGGAVRG